ncbi:hypothetical protein SUGI_0702730 [Cryptomeria japonica]|nr:hypothetical protein SUGI_0702730 [Cryptomeria japonica]
MIFTSWAKLSRNYSTASLNRSNTRCMLCPRDFPGYSAKIDNMYVRHSSEECSRENTHPPPLASNGIMDLQFYANKDGLIHDAIKSAANEEDIQSLIDFVETTKPTPVLAKI